MGTLVSDLEVFNCWVCGTRFAFVASVADHRRRTGKDFYCTNGCHLAFGEGTEAVLKRQLEAEKAERERQAKIAAEERTARYAAERKHELLRRRTRAGICPECRRKFPDLASHVKHDHPRAKPAK